MNNTRPGPFNETRMIMFFRLLAYLFLPVMVASCAGEYQYLTVKEIQYSDLFNLTAHVIDRQGFALEEMNPSEGYIESYWDYEKLVDVGRFPIRRKVECQIDPDGESTYKIKLRITQEALWESYMVNEPEHRKNWETYGVDKETARNILTRINLMVKDFEPSDEFYDRWRRKEEFKKGVPDVLKDPERE